jgi:SAM-dependent methyltransferase
MDKPSAWVERFLPLIPQNRGPILDLACGSGRHTRLLLDAGYDVWCVDRDASVLPPLQQLGATCFQIDLETVDIAMVDSPSSVWPFMNHHFAGVIVTNYLHRPLFPKIAQALVDDGILIYETFAAGNQNFGRPTNPHFLLRSGELLESFLFGQIDVLNKARRKHCIAYENGYIDLPKPAVVQRICIRFGCQDNAQFDRI